MYSHYNSKTKIRPNYEAISPRIAKVVANPITNDNYIKKPLVFEPSLKPPI